MDRKTYRYVRVSEYIEIPVPSDCSREQEQEFIIKFKTEHDLAEMEKDYCQLASRAAEGCLPTVEETFPLEELIHELQETQKEFDKRPL